MAKKKSAPNEPCICAVCGKKCNNKYNLKLHEVSHSRATEFPCNMCDKIFPSSQKLRRHQIMHIDTKEFQCETCKKLFKRHSSLKLHMSTHMEERPRKHICSVCNKGFYDNQALQNHLKNPYVHYLPCKICSERFPNQETLDEHVATHPDKPFSCHECYRTFAKREHLAQHRFRHSKGNSYVCDVCKESFYSKGNLILHSLTHKKDNDSSVVEEMSDSDSVEQQDASLEMETNTDFIPINESDNLSSNVEMSNEPQSPVVEKEIEKSYFVGTLKKETNAALAELRGENYIEVSKMKFVLIDD